MAKEIKFRIRLSVDGKEQLVTATTSSRDLQKNLDAARSSAIRFRDAMLTMNQMGQAFQGLISGLSQVNSALSSYTQAYATQEQNEQRLATVMRERMNATAADVEQMKALAAAQQQLGIIGDEVQLAGMQQLATFIHQKDTLAQLVPAMNNLIAQQKGYNATAGDAQTIGNLLGKAMQGQATALRRVGISFDETQEKVLKFGTESERASMLAEIITQNVGNMNAELRQTTSGQMKALSNTMGDLSEKVGAVMMPFQGIMQQVTQLGFLFLSLGQIVSTARGVMIALGAAIKSTGIASLFFSKQAYIQTAATLMLNGASKATALSLAALKVALRGLLIASGIGAVIAGLTIVVEKLMNASDKADDSLDDMANSANEVSQAYTQAKSSIDLNIAKLKDLINQKQQGKNVTKQEKEMLSQLNNTYGETMGYFASVEAWYKALTANSEVYCEQMVIEAQTRRLANQIAEKREKQRSITRNDDGSRKRYGTKRDTQLVATGQVDAGDGKVLPTYETKEIVGTSPIEKAQKAYDELGKSIAADEKQLDALVKKGAQLKMPVTGASTAPAPAGSGSKVKTQKTDTKRTAEEAKWQEGSLADLENKLSEQQDKLKNQNLNLEEQVEIYGEIIQLNKQINTLKEQQAKADIEARGRMLAKDSGLADIASGLTDGSKLSVGIELKPQIDTKALEESMERLKNATQDGLAKIPTIAGLTTDNFKTAANALGEFGGAMQEMGRLVKDEGLQVAGIVAEAIANIALGYARATAEAASLTPFGWIAFAAAGLGQMLAMISAIHSATGYATGGIVGGTSYNGDKLFARLNSGEMVLNKTQQAKLWNMINNGTAIGAVRPATAGVAGVAGMAGGNVRFELEGRKLVGVLSNETRIGSRSGRRTNIKL